MSENLDQYSETFVNSSDNPSDSSVSKNPFSFTTFLDRKQECLEIIGEKHLDFVTQMEKKAYPEKITFASNQSNENCDTDFLVDFKDDMSTKSGSSDHSGNDIKLSNANMFSNEDSHLDNSEVCEIRLANLNLIQELKQSKIDNEILRKRIEVLHNKELEESKALESVILQIESRLDKANKRAFNAESKLAQIDKEFSFKSNHDSNIKEFYERETSKAATKIRLASTEAEYFLNQLLSGASNLRNLADFIESIPRIYDPKSSEVSSGEK